MGIESIVLWTHNISCQFNYTNIVFIVFFYYGYRLEHKSGWVHNFTVPDWFRAVSLKYSSSNLVIIYPVIGRLGTPVCMETPHCHSITSQYRGRSIFTVCTRAGNQLLK
jgi:hypothetical protein